MPDWFRDHQMLLGCLAAFSVVTLFAAIVAAPIVLTRMRADYFMPDRDRRATLAKQHPVLRWAGLILKNLLGAILLLAGFVMLFMPGQGLLTILIGLILTDFPKKRALELRLVRIPALRKAIDWVREKRGRAPLELPEK